MIPFPLPKPYSFSMIVTLAAKEAITSTPPAITESDVHEPVEPPPSLPVEITRKQKDPGTSTHVSTIYIKGPRKLIFNNNSCTVAENEQEPSGKNDTETAQRRVVSNSKETKAAKRKKPIKRIPSSESDDSSSDNGDEDRQSKKPRIDSQRSRG
jgi:hypothetical protein